MLGFRYNFNGQDKKNHSDQVFKSANSKSFIKDYWWFIESTWKSCLGLKSIKRKQNHIGLLFAWPIKILSCDGIFTGVAWAQKAFKEIYSFP